MFGRLRLISLFMLPVLVRFAIGQRCGNNGYLRDKTCYQIFTGKLTQTDAIEMCRKKYNGQILSLNSMNQESWIKNNVAENFSDPIWLQTVQEETPSWEFAGNRKDPKSPVKILWKEGEPSTTGGCGVLSFYQEYKYAAHRCSNKYMAVCSTDKSKATDETFWKKCDGDICYGNVLEPLSWYKARETCQKNDGDITTVADTRSWTTIVALLLKDINSLLQNNPGLKDFYAHAWIGINNFLLLQKAGSPVEAIYTNWAEGEPSIGAAAKSYTKRCVLLTKEGWRMTTCEQKHSSICLAHVDDVPTVTTIEPVTTTTATTTGDKNKQRATGGEEKSEIDFHDILRIIAISIGGLFVITLTVMIIFCICSYRARKENEEIYRMKSRMDGEIGYNIDNYDYANDPRTVEGKEESPANSDSNYPIVPSRSTSLLPPAVYVGNFSDYNQDSGQPALQQKQYGSSATAF